MLRRLYSSKLLIPGTSPLRTKHQEAWPPTPSEKRRWGTTDGDRVLISMLLVAHQLPSCREPQPSHSNQLNSALQLLYLILLTSWKTCYHLQNCHRTPLEEVGACCLFLTSSLKVKETSWNTLQTHAMGSGCFPC